MATEAGTKRARTGRTAAEVAAEPHSQRIFAQLNQEDRLRSIAVSAIVLGITNPEYTQLGLRFRDPYNSEKTATYYSWDKPNSSSVWPQAIVQNLPMADGTANVNVPNDHGSYLQYTQFLFHSLMRRWIQEDKNSAKYYTAYRCYGLDGSIDFPVDNSAALTEMTDLKIGGAYFDPGVLSGGGLQGAGNPFNNTNMTTGSGTINPALLTLLPAHETVMAPGEFRGDTWLWNDGCSLAKPSTTAGVGAKICVNGAVGGANLAANQVNVNGANSTGLKPNVAASNLTGSLNIAHGAVPIAAGTNFAVQIYGYNEGTPYELPYASVSGVIGAAPAVDQVFFSYPISLPDYYRVRISLNGQTQDTGASVRMWFINTGEMWRQRQTPSAAQNYGSIQAHRGLGTTLLSTNDTPLQYKGGRAVTTQLPLGQDWMTIVDGQDPFSQCTKTLREKDKNFEHGHFSWLRIADVKDSMVMKKEVWPSNAIRDTIVAGVNNVTKQPYCFAFQLNKVSTLAQCISAPSSTTPQSVQFSLSCNGEYTTGNQWQHDNESEYTSKDWEDAISVMATFEQGMENEEHDAKTLMAATKEGAGRQVDGFLKGLIDTGLPLVEKGISSLVENAGNFLPLVAAALL